MAKDEIIIKYNNKIEELKNNGEIEDYLILELAKTAIWLTKCAIHYKEKIGKTDDLETKEKYLKLVRTFYDLKIKIVKLLLKTNKYEIEFHEPKIKHQLKNLVMCNNHKKIFEDSKINLSEFLNHNNKFTEIHHCEECSYDLEKAFYCLYYLTIKVDDISVKLNIPYLCLKNEKEVNKTLKVDRNWKIRKEEF